ncbi:MAG: hypothetical protein V4492_08530 [Chlamydiota bacterium]
MLSKRSYRFTLLEVVIAIALLGVILSALFGCFQQTLKKNIVARELKQKVLQIELLNSRLQQLFAHLESGKDAALWLQEYSGAKNEALFVTYSQTIDRDPLFLGALTGVLYLDAKGQLVIETKGKKEAKRTEVLLDGVGSLRWDLFDPVQGKWSAEWPKKKAKTPAMIRLSFDWKRPGSRTKKNLGIPPLVYFISSPGEPITYQEAT